MGITIGDAILWIRGKDEKLDGDLKNAEGQIKGWAGKINTVVKGMIGVGVTAAISSGVRKITDSLIDLANESINTGLEYGKQVAQMKRITGLSADESSRLIQIADDMELSYEGLSTAIRMFSTEQGKAGKNTKIGVDQLAALSDEYLRLAPGTERNTFLIKNFGRGGLEMAHLMEQGGEKIREMSDAVEDNLIMTDEAIAIQERYRVSIDNLGDGMDALKVKLGLALAPLKTEWNEFLARVVLPILERLIDKFLKLPVPAQEAIVALVLLGRGASGAAPQIMGAAYALKILGGTGPILKVLAGILKFTLLPALVAVGIYLEVKLIDQLARSGAKLGQKIAEWTGIWDLLPQEVRDMSITLQTEGLFSKAYWDSVGKVIGLFFTGFVRDIGAWLDRAFKEFGRFMTRVTEWAISLASKVGAWFNKIGTGIVDGIWSGIQGAWEGLKTKVATALDNLLKWIQDKIGAHSESQVYKIKIGRPMGEGIGMGLQESMREQVQQIFQLGVQGMTLVGAQAAQNISVGHVEYHGRFSQAEMAMLDARHDERAERILLRSLSHSPRR